MDKILSARVDDSVIRRIGALAHQLGMTKKAIIENSVRCYAEQIEQEQKMDVLDMTCGAWRRNEPADDTITATKQEFRRSMKRTTE